MRLDNFQQFAAINVTSDPGAIGGKVQVPQCAQIVIQWGLESGRIGHNVLYGRYAGGFVGTAAQCNSILTGLTSGGAWTALAAFLATSSGLSGVTIRDVNTVDQPLISNSVGGQPGTSASPSLPNEAAVVVTLRTAKAGAQNRGRMFIPGWATNALGAGNVVAAAAVTALNNWANTIPGVLGGQGYTWVIGQRERVAYTGSTGTQHPARAATSTQITSQSARDNHWDTQRKRGLR